MNSNSSKPPRTYRTVVVSLFILALPFVAFVCFIIGTLRSLEDEHWTIQDIQKYLTVDIPKDAQGLVYSSGANRYVHVEMSFTSSPENTLDFASHFCDGILHSGYDPFNAINVDKPVANSVKIDLIDYYTRSYYSYSPKTPQTKYGVFCYLYGGLYWLLIDKIDSSLYKIRFKHIGNRTPIYADVKLVADFPIIVRGLMPELGGGYSAYQRICLDLDPDIVSETSQRWSSLIGSDIHVLIDNHLMTDAYVSVKGRLARKDGKNNYADPDSNLFQYCLIVRRGGLHTMTIELPPSFVAKNAYSWTFTELYSETCGHDYPDNDCF